MSMRDLVISIFGEYTPVTYTMSDGMTVVPEGMAGVDWAYIGGLVLFAIVLYSVLRLFGVVLKR